MTLLQSTKTTKVIGISQNKKNPENYKVSSSGHNLFNLLLMTLRILFSAKNGMDKWVFHIREAIFSMVLQEQVKVPSLRQLQLKLKTQFALSTVLIKLMTLILIDC
jgi:hypothetical protein